MKIQLLCRNCNGNLANDTVTTRIGFGPSYLTAECVRCDINYALKIEVSDAGKPESHKEEAI